MNSAIGKWISTTCCACFASSAACGSKGFNIGEPYCTITLPVILGCTEQKYGYVPGLIKVKENFSSVSRTLDLKTLSSLTTVWGMSSRFVQVTVVPAATVMAAGPKLKLSIFTSMLAGAC